MHHDKHDMPTGCILRAPRLAKSQKFTPRPAARRHAFIYERVYEAEHISSPTRPFMTSVSEEADLPEPDLASDPAPLDDGFDF
jgi:hypothetical protein